MNNTMSCEAINFDSLKIPIPELIKQYPLEKQSEILEYLKNLDSQHIQAYLIALNHLGSSFNIYKSNGFKEWQKMNTASK